MGSIEPKETLRFDCRWNCCFELFKMRSSCCLIICNSLESFSSPEVESNSLFLFKIFLLVMSKDCVCCLKLMLVVRGDDSKGLVESELLVEFTTSEFRLLNDC